MTLAKVTGFDLCPRLARLKRRRHARTNASRHVVGDQLVECLVRQAEHDIDFSRRVDRLTELVGELLGKRDQWLHQIMQARSTSDLRQTLEHEFGPISFLTSEDLGTVIGRGGRTAKALRQIIGSIGGRGIRVDIVDAY